jgi:mono/diheme cytochrome c family protein
MCHGNEGKGDGPAGASLNPKPRNFVEGKWTHGGTRLGLMEVLEDGIKGSSMQSYKHMPINDRWALVHFIRSITTNKVADNDADVAAKAPNLK